HTVTSLVSLSLLSRKFSPKGWPLANSRCRCDSSKTDCARRFAQDYEIQRRSMSRHFGVMGTYPAVRVTVEEIESEVIQAASFEPFVTENLFDVSDRCNWVE